MPLPQSIRRRLALILALAAGPLAASAGELDPAVTPEALADKAVVVISVTHEPDSASHLQTGIDGSSLFDRESLDSYRGVMGFSEASDFTDRHGHVFVLELAPGHHKLSGWRVPSGGGDWHPAGAPPPLEFDVAKGDALYLGNIDALMKLGHRTIFKSRVAAGVEVTVQDRAGQDIAVAEKTHPGLAGRIRPALLTQGPWIGADGAKTSDAPLPPIPPLPPKK
jgi:hypothetical protein